MIWFGRWMIGTCLLLAFAPDAAARKPPLEFHPAPAAAPTAQGGVCVVGSVADDAYVVNYVLPPDDSYYTLLPDGSCSEPLFAPDLAHARIHFPVACEQQFEVSIVAAIGDSCPRPDPTQILCGPIAYDYTPPAAGTHDVVVTVGPCSFSNFQETFLRVTFVTANAACSTLATRPRLVTGDQCARCASYNEYPGSGQDDLCRLLFPGRPIMYVETKAVPVERRSWGDLKLRYH